MHAGEETTNRTTPLPADSDPSYLVLVAENEQLRQQVRQLTEERDAYLRCLHAWAWDRVPEEELRRWAEDESEEGATFEQVLQMLKEHGGS